MLASGVPAPQLLLPQHPMGGRHPGKGWCWDRQGATPVCLQLKAWEDGGDAALPVTTLASLVHGPAGLQPFCSVGMQPVLTDTCVEPSIGWHFYNSWDR